MKTKNLLCLLLTTFMISCSQDDNDVTITESENNLVQVNVNFKGKLPDKVVQIDIVMRDDTLIDNTLVNYPFSHYIYRKDMGDAISILLNSKPNSYGIPYATGIYKILLNRGDGYYYSILPELDLKEIHKYSKLEYDLVNIDDSWTPEDYYNRGTAHYTLISSKSK